MTDGNGADKRRHKRIYFSMDHNVTATLRMPGSQDADLPVKILNLGEGGLFFTIRKEKTRPVQAGNTVLLKNIHGPAPLNFSQDLTMEVKWISDDPALENIGYGCEFTDLPTQLKALLQEMVAKILTGSWQ